MSLPKIEPSTLEASTLEKSHSNSLLTSIRNIYTTYERKASGECSPQSKLSMLISKPLRKKSPKG
jgi:hypothetical protein